MTQGAALARLEQLRQDAVLAEPEWTVAREAMLALMEGSPGRCRRAVAYDSLKGAFGAPFLIEDAITRAARGRYKWSSLALELPPEGLLHRILGVPYGSDPKRWHDLLDKLERLRQLRQDESLTAEQFARVKYPVLGRLQWLELVGDLLWERRQSDEWVYWMREDGWAVSDHEIQECRESMLAFHAPEGLRPRRLYEWSVDRCWQFYDDAIATGDIQYLSLNHITRMDQDRWSF